MLQLFSADWCGACKQLKKFLTEQDISYVERNVDNDADARKIMERLQLRSIPVLYKDDANFIVGAKYKEVLELAKKSSDT